MQRSRSLLRLARPRHWIKNVLVFAALLFSRRITDARAAAAACVGFIAFCLASSAVYAWNDVLDRDQDARHPIKCRRPVAAGEISVFAALAFGAVMALLALALSTAINRTFSSALGLYLLLMLGYIFGLKRLAILDVLILASGFAIRAYAGGAAADVPVSSWLILCTLNLAIFLGFAKRAGERAMLGDAPERALSLEASLYDTRSLGDMMIIAAALAATTYMLYTISPETIARVGHSWMCLTVLPVLYGVLRFYRMAILGKASDPVDLIYRDPAFVLALLVWLGMAAFLLFV